MDVIFRDIFIKKIRIFLIFFCFSVIYSCKNNTDLPLDITINYEGTDALNVTFVSNKATKDLNFFLQGMQEPILGDFEKANDKILFRPIVPFSNGKTYDIKYLEKTIGSFSINAYTPTNATLISAIYPSRDTVPENLLKMYFVFSKPMQEVQSALDYIEVFNVTDSISTSIFLELQNELWNENHTELTLWLDPGRIKTDLIPNRTQGLPLEEGKQYQIRILSSWTDAQNNKLDKDYIKNIYVAKKDRTKPSVDQWSIIVPTSGTNTPMILTLNEPLDAMLALETMLIYNQNKELVKGTFELTQYEEQLLFTPVEPWKPGLYHISVTSILEDLAGNNLNHLFDVDLTAKDAVNNHHSEVHELSFKIR